MLTRMPWTRAKPEEPDEESDVVTVSVTSKQMLSRTQYEDLTGMQASEAWTEATVTFTRAARAPKKRQERLQCYAVPMKGSVKLKGDIGIKTAPRIGYAFNPPMQLPLRGSVKINGAIDA